MRGRARVTSYPLIPAKAGTQIHPERSKAIRNGAGASRENEVGFTWVPAFAGMSGVLPIAERDPSSDRSPTGHLLPQGEKGPTS